MTTNASTREDLENKLADALTEYLLYWIQRDRDYEPPEENDDGDK